MAAKTVTFDKQELAKQDFRRFTTCKKAGEEVGVSEVTIRRMLTKKQLTRFKLNGRTLIDREELFRLIRKTEPAA